MINSLLSNNCYLCNQDTDRFCCRPCMQDLINNQTHCIICAVPTTYSTVCGRCQKNKPIFANTFAPFSYQYPINQIICAAKYHSQPELFIELSRSFVNHLKKTQTELPQAIIPVPTHYSKQRLRGYNQATYLAQLIAKPLALPVISDAVIKHCPTTPQNQLKSKQRYKNVLNSFSLIKAINYQHISIVDDVMTTGATVNEVARLLYPSCPKISIWVIARTPHH